MKKPGLKSKLRLLLVYLIDKDYRYKVRFINNMTRAIKHSLLVIHTVNPSTEKEKKALEAIIDIYKILLEFLNESVIRVAEQKIYLK